MAELSLKERLQPSLLDRLSDDDPHSAQESRESRVLSINRLRDCVTRDLAWLLNTESLDSITDLSTLPEVARSTLNYGIRSFSGKTSSGVPISVLENRIRDSIIQFEPRILAETLVIRARVDEDHMSTNAITFEIEGELWAQPLPLHLYLQTEVDLETGHVSIHE